MRERERGGREWERVRAGQGERKRTRTRMAEEDKRDSKWERQGDRERER